MELKRTKLINYLRSFGLVLLTPFANGQEGASSQPFALEPPIMTERTQPNYPRIAAQNGDEGWVMFSYMVDTEGSAYEPMIVGSTGSKRFEEAAMKALLDSKFEPASLNGEPVDGSGFFKYTFAMNGGVGASRSFVTRYKKFRLALENDELEEATQLLESMEKMSNDNLYEEAFVNLSRFFLAQKFGDQETQLASLNKALAYASRDNENVDFLPDDMIPVARSELLRLQINNMYYFEALETYAWMKREDDANYMEVFEPLIKQIEEIARDDTPYAIQGKIDGLLPWYIDLLKRAFYFESVDGGLDEIKLRCNGAFRSYPYQENALYSIPASWGDCQLQAIGQPETTFYLVQLSPEVSEQ